jgi:hypothetical protein
MHHHRRRELRRKRQSVVVLARLVVPNAKGVVCVESEEKIAEKEELEDGFGGSVEGCESIGLLQIRKISSLGLSHGLEFTSLALS